MPPTTLYLDPEFEDLTPEKVAQLNKTSQSRQTKSRSLSESTTKKSYLAPREYQYEIFKKAISQNIIAVLDTGAGKPLISVMLIKHMLALENKKCRIDPNYKKKVTFFLVDRVPLVFQQANVIHSNIDARIEEMCGEMNTDSWSLSTWRDKIDNNDICVMTAQIFLDNLQRGFLSLDEVNLLVFDECHHAVKGHPFNLIMYQFYHRIVSGNYKPKVFGMTASPIFNKKDIYKGIKTLETNLDSEVYTARNSVELSNAVNKPSEPMIYYSMEVIDDLPQQMHQNQKPQQSDGNYYAERQKTINVKLRYTSRTILTTLISSKIKDIDGYKDCLTVADYISNNLGPWCCDRLWKVMLEGARNTHGLFESPSHYANTRNLNSNEVQSMEEAYALCSTPADATDPNINNSKLFTPKAKALIDCLIDLNIKKDGSEEEFRCIVFVERRYTAVAIKLLIDSLTIFKDVIKSDILIGHGDNQNNRGGVRMKFHDQNSVISKFRKGELNLMIATNVAEEGLDIQACNYVIRFDIFKTLSAYIQSRGRARRPNSKYIMLINSQNPKETNILLQFKDVEAQMKEFCRMLPEDKNVAKLFYYGGIDYEDDLMYVPPWNPECIKREMQIKYLRDAYEIPETGAILTRNNAISLIYHYCDSLPSDNFCNFKPIYKIIQVKSQVVDKIDMFQCTLTLPINSSLQKFDTVNISKDDVKMSVSLNACIALHKAGALDDHLVPICKKKKTLLAEKEEQQREGNGLQIGSRSRENYYRKEMPLFWSSSPQKNDVLRNGATDLVAGDEAATSELAMGPYWISCIEFHNTDIPFRKMCLITKKPCPDIPDIEIFQTNSPFIARINHSIKLEISFEKEKRLDLLIDYMFVITRCVTNKEFTCPRQDVPYFLAPLKQDNSIDWKEVKRSIRNDNNKPLDGNDLEDTIIIDHKDQHRRHYFVKNTQTNLTFQSQVAPLLSVTPKLRETGYDTFAKYYEAQDDIEITDKNQPLLQVERIYKTNTFFLAKKQKEEEKKEQQPDSIVYYLPPEVCRLYCVSASVFQTCQLLPLIMSRMDATLLAQDAKEVLNLNWIQDRIMMEALTASSASMHINYQRLELLGDSVLKFISSTHVFTQYPLYNEQDLTVARTSMISNATLFQQSSQKLKSYKYICSQNLPLRRYWRPPFFTCTADSEEMIHKINYHKLADKTLADVIESILGAAWISSNKNVNLSLDAARQLGVPVVDESWSDFNKVFLSTRPQSTFDPSLHEVDIARVTDIVGYHFKDPSLIAEALTHASVLDSSVACYQRLEFLGDAVLDFCVTNYLYEKNPDAPPGHLHDLRKSSVNNAILSLVCVQLKLYGHIRHLSDSLVSAIQYFIEELNQVDKDKKEYWNDLKAPKVLGDIIESLMGAVYVDNGFDLKPCMDLFERWLKPILDERISLDLIEEHPSGKFMSLVQNMGCTQSVISNLTNFADSQQKCIIFIHNTPVASGTGTNMDEARKIASRKACQIIQNSQHLVSSLCTCHDSD